MKRRKDILVVILFGAVMAIMAIALCKGLKTDAEKTKIVFSKPDKFFEGWRNADTGDGINGSMIIEEGAVVKVENRLPEDMEGKSCLSIYNPQLNIKVELDGKLLAELGKGSLYETGTEVGAKWSIIPLPEECAGNRITLTMTNNGYRQRFSFSKIYIGVKNELVYKLLMHTLPEMVLVSVVMVWALILIIYSIFLYIYKVEQPRPQIVRITMFTLACWTWFITDGAVLQFVMEDATIGYMLSYFSFYLIPALMILIYKGFINKWKKFFTGLVHSYVLFIGIIIALYVADVWHIEKSVLLVHLYIAVIFIAIAASCIHETFVLKNKSVRGPLIAFIILGFAGAVDYVKRYILHHESSTITLKSSFMAFMLILGITTVRESLEVFKDKFTSVHYKKLAYVDNVTGGNTRISFEDKLESIWKNKSEGKRLWFLYMNIHNFKLVNEVIGWKNGSKLLSRVYEQNESILEASEIQCNMGNASYGFLFCTGDDLEELHKKCQKLKEGFESCIQKMYKELSIDVSFCAAPFNNEKYKLTNLLDHAIMATGNPKADYWQDVNCYVYNEECGRKLLYEKNLENQLEKALENREFEMYLQPKVYPETGELAGAEALVRWNNPSEGVISPGVFVPVFEKNGMISKIDLEMFRQVCELLCNWKERDIEPIVISVNVSKVDMRYKTFSGRYGPLIKKIGELAKYIEFEFTESTAYVDCDEMNRILEWIHQVGAKCSMDDFGSSYSNLSAIQILDFDTVKVDKCFFDDGFPNQSRGFQMIDSLIQMFKKLGIKVVAEGIEDKSQMQALKRLQCDMIQGYYYSKPLCVKEFEEFRKSFASGKKSESVKDDKKETDE